MNIVYFVVPNSIYSDFLLQDLADKNKSSNEKEDSQERAPDLMKDSKKRKRRLSKIVRQFALLITIE